MSRDGLAELQIEAGMELRDIEIFLTLAEELHFGRTAQRLHVSQARVSQAINQQERRLGGALFDRSNRRQVRLTALGRQLRDDLRPVYTGLRDSLERARLAARGITHILQVGMLPINAYDLRPFWDTFRTRHPEWQLRLQQAPFVDPFAALRRREIDVLVAWLPVEEPDLTVGPTLFAEPRVLAVPTDHELTQRTSVSLEAISHFQHVNVPTAPNYWYDSYIPTHTRAGSLIERGPAVRAVEDIFTLTSTGEVVTLFPSHMTRYSVRPDIAYLPVRDMSALPYALVWHTESETEPIRALARTARDLGPVETRR
ncbi:DNA-binding transcriptional LysR family regulator [Kibdelosporangium banguiense]|uniref:DNA-binding transcriptional LysR family regulator n=1 Tax=Kibdelosporangium banguiense TaxID=1365924 RepID=A0ABS4TUL8_9PSEU|nr:LysR substrate-binding domain-containing protein [Kibdelosporangium banguiense]MBP2328090.1 DNA-binding transcriptional LysR family regulator [Kibdelosporangium banguiense]